jgi:hypothetical protein
MDFQDTKRVQNVASKAIFEQNAERIGLLTDNEVEAVLRYYQELSQFEDYIVAYSQREGGGSIQNRAEPLIQAKEDAVHAIGQELKVD